METVITVVQVALGLAAVLALVRVVRGPSLADRIIALDLILFLIAGTIAAQSAREGTQYFVPVLVAVSLVAFASTVLIARFIEYRDAP